MQFEDGCVSVHEGASLLPCAAEAHCSEHPVFLTQCLVQVEALAKRGIRIVPFARSAGSLAS
jgi:hypothetical protein